jgi:hypothetical protein
MRGLRHGEDGLTMIEVMVASMLLIVGMLGVLSMFTGAIRTTTTSNTRVAATNLARELIETAREIAYDDLGGIVAQAQSRGLGAGTPWTIVRRGVVYTVTAATCVFDSPTDGYAATAPSNACTSRPAGADPNGEDFRRVTFRFSWRDDSRVRTMSQSTLVINPSGGLGPRILTTTPLSQTITANVSSVSVAWITTFAQSLIWEIDDGVSGGTLTGSTSFTATWQIGVSGSGTEVFDGAYTMNGRAFDERDIPGETRSADIVLNRRAPYAPTNFEGGHNTRVGPWTEFEWSLNRERDILGYRVVWAGPDNTLATTDDEQVCPAPADGSRLSPTTNDCVDFDSASGPQKYSVVALDRDASGALRKGDARSVTVPSAGSRPARPLVLALLTVSGLPRLTWTAPLLTDVAFYRIYRDGSAVGYADRYDRTTGGLITTYTDTDPGTVSHRYWVTAVDTHYNESNPIGPVTWTP